MDDNIIAQLIKDVERLKVKTELQSQEISELYTIIEQLEQIVADKSSKLGFQQQEG